MWTMEEKLVSTLKIHAADNVAVALEAARAGDKIKVNGAELSVRDDVPAGHKIALRDLKAGDSVVKYGYPIGHATGAIPAGSHIHVQNIKTGLGANVDYRYEPLPRPALPAPAPLFFDGYLREDGRVGTRNEIWILVTVGCVNKIAEGLAAEANEEFRGRGLDGVLCFPHPYGCSQLGDDHAYTQKILADMVGHPNAGAVLVVGLGCENNNFKEFKKVLGPVDPKRVKFLQSQDVEDEREEGMTLLRQLADFAEGFMRSAQPLSKLVLGTKCGGSDGFSGITANPLVGRMADRVTGQGGTALLTEVPEMFGAEGMLMNRCVDQEIFQRQVDMINGFKAYFQRYGQVIYENPSPGNKDGGISTLEEKSLGCVQKGGTSPVVGVLDYGVPVERKGLNLVSAPGNDAVSVTALAAAGAQIILFTTGRGTPFGGAVPTLKIATNSALATRKRGWIDFDAGCLLNGESIEDAEQELLALIIDCASGRIKARNEENGFREIAIFKDGVTM